MSSRGAASAICSLHDVRPEITRRHTSHVTWTESDSRLYQELAAVAVPDRAEQMATLLTSLPFGAADRGRVVELGCGEGRLTQAILEAFPNSTAVALDGSPDMRAHAAARLHTFGVRASVAEFDLGSADWWPLLAGADAVVSSLAIHHLDGPGKQRLFGAIATRVSPSGALLIADLVQPKRVEAQELFASGWDAAATRQSRRQQVLNLMSALPTSGTGPPGRQDRGDRLRFRSAV
jgi:tRNA (cmo5U34)-methyltransferase